VEYENDGDLTVFNLYISDSQVKREQKKRTTDFTLPVVIYGMEELFRSIPQYLPEDFLNFIVIHPLLNTGIDCSLILLMVYSMAMLAYKQKLYILIPAAFSIFVATIS
jgi:hypothetical protein